MGQGRKVTRLPYHSHTLPEPLSWPLTHPSYHLFGPSGTTAPYSKPTGSAPPAPWSHGIPFVCLYPLPQTGVSPKPESLKRALPMGVAHQKPSCAHPNAPEGRTTAGSSLYPYSLQAQKSVWLKVGALKNVC